MPVKKYIYLLIIVIVYSQLLITSANNILSCEDVNFQLFADIILFALGLASDTISMDEEGGTDDLPQTSEVLSLPTKDAVSVDKTPQGNI